LGESLASNLQSRARSLERDPQGHEGLRYRAEIDSLRALAVIPVLVFHFNAEWLPGGYLGVDVFFVISGFLITSIILTDLDRETFKFRRFWSRRVRRILPVLAVVVFTSSLFAFFTLYAPDLNNVGREGIAALLSYANIFYWLEAGNYWGQAAKESLFLHTWSLSVEEQFYLFFPVLTFFVYQWDRKLLLPCFALLVATSACLFLLGEQRHPTATFYLLPTRMWELGAGCFLAAATFQKGQSLIEKVSERFCVSLSVFGLALISSAYVLADGGQGATGYAFLAVVGSVLYIAFFPRRKTLFGSLMKGAAPVFIGKLSYSLYLWHWPVILFGMSYVGTQSTWTFCLLIAITFCLSITTYFLIERPFRRPTSSLPVILSLSGLILMAHFVLAERHLIEDTSKFAPTVWYGHQYQVAPRWERSEAVRIRMSGIDMSSTQSGSEGAYKNGGIVNFHGEPQPSIMVFGDSHALMWSKLIDEIARAMGKTVSYHTANGVEPFYEIPVKPASAGANGFDRHELTEYRQSQLEHLNLWRPRVVIISARWGRAFDAEYFRDFVSHITGLGSRVLMIEQPPVLAIGNKNVPQYLSYIGVDPDEHDKFFLSAVVDPERELRRNQVEGICLQNESCDIVSILDLYLEGQDALVLNENSVLYIDDDHLSQAGAELAFDRLRKALDASSR